MGLFSRGPRPGEVWRGHACYSDDYSLVDRPGFYALDETGKKVLPKIRLTWVDCAPGDDQDGSGFYEVSGKRGPIARAASGEDMGKLYEGQLVELQATAQGKADLRGEDGGE